MTGPAGERRVVSVLIADLEGSTAIGEKLGPERSKLLLDEVLVRLIAGEVKRRRWNGGAIRRRRAAARCSGCRTPRG